MTKKPEDQEQGKAREIKTPDKWLESLEQTHNDAEKTLGLGSRESRTALSQSHMETIEILRQSCDRNFTLSRKLHKKNQEMLDKLQELSSKANNPAVQSLSQEIHSIIDTIIESNKELRLFEEDEVFQLKSRLESKAGQLKLLQEAESQELTVLQEINSEQIREIQASITDGLKKIQKN